MLLAGRVRAAFREWIVRLLESRQICRIGVSKTWRGSVRKDSFPRKRDTPQRNREDGGLSDDETPYAIFPRYGSFQLQWSREWSRDCAH